MEPDSAGIVGSLGAAIGLGIAYAVNLISKRFGDGAVASANAQAQKDMLNWQREQLEAEVARREKAESLVQQMYEKVNELTHQMSALQLQNQELKRQVEHLSDLIASLKGISP